MSVDSVLDGRYALWRELLCDDYGYEEDYHTRPPASRHELAFRAVRPGYSALPAIAVDIRELWMPGRDPHGLGLEDDDCFLSLAAWHAQLVAAAGAEGAERLDVDRRKQPPHITHRHPFGQANCKREPAAPLKHPAAWIAHVELLIAEAFGF